MTVACSANNDANGFVSIIVPVYNAEKFLRRSIESVLAQTYGKFELLLVNDGSTDSSNDICESYAARDSRIIVTRQINSGPAAARNNGVRRSTGEYVFFLDADDYIKPDALELLVSAYDRHQPDLVMCNFGKQVDAGGINGQRVSFTPENQPFEGKEKLLYSSDLAAFVRHFLKYPSNHLISYCWARLYKASTLKTHAISSNEEMRLFEDFVLNLDYISSAEKAVFLNEPLYVYVMHSNHVSASMGILNSKSLLHDMGVFREKASDYLRLKNNGAMSEADIAKEIGHTIIHYLIIFLVRSCLQLTEDNRRPVYEEISAMVNAPLIRDSLRYYTPSKGNSRILPQLMKLKLVRLIMSVCRYKAHKRYGKA